MNRQLSLLPNVRRSDPATSHSAARVDHTGLRADVERVLREHRDGLTDWEITTLLGLPDRRKGSVVKRRAECGAVPTDLTRPSPDGRPCVVWRLP